MDIPLESADAGLQDLLTLVERESARMSHYYLGVEHLFIALTRVENGATVNALRELRLSPRFVRQAIRAAAGSGDNKRYWPAFRPTPRYEKIIESAAALAQNRGAARVEERDMLLAILHEGQSIPVRVLTHLGVELERMIAIVYGWEDRAETWHPLIPIAGADLSADQRRLLSQMFRSYASLEVEREFSGFSGARVLLARPIKTDGRADAAVVVKIDHGQGIRYEQIRYDSYVKATLPPVTARITDLPVVLDPPNIGGLKYTLVGQQDSARTQTLLEYVRANGPAVLRDIIANKIYNTFGNGWWKQRQPYSFHLWQEYEHVLPPALVVELDPSVDSVDHTLTPKGDWSRDGSVHVGDCVMLDGFTLYRVYPGGEQIALVGGSGPAASERAYKVIVRGVTHETASQGERVHQLLGRVAQTRQDTFNARVREIFPHLDPTAFTVAPLPGMEALWNPLAFYRRMLDMQISGTLSTIHGDLHLGNIVIDPEGDAWLIDFRWARDGHTLFDWAVLEVSLWADVVAPLAEAALERAVKMALALNEREAPPRTLNLALSQVLVALAAVRQVAEECLAQPADWTEYFAALTFCALRALEWPQVTANAKRLLFVVAALALLKIQQKDGKRFDHESTQATTDSSPSSEAYSSG